MSDPTQMNYLYQDFDNLMSQHSTAPYSNPAGGSNGLQGQLSGGFMSQPGAQTSRPSVWQGATMMTVPSNTRPIPLDWGDSIEQELDFFLKEDEEDPLKAQIEDAKRKAKEFMQVLKNKFPNRYFLLKRITQNPLFWQTCCFERGYVIIEDDSYAKKLQNCYEVMRPDPKSIDL